METIIKEPPGYRINEYLIVLNPREELRNKIKHVQQQFSEKFHAAPCLGNKPNIPLVKFAQYEMMEKRLLDRLKAITLGYHPVKIELKDYGCFPSHTIFINVVSKAPIQDLVKQIRTGAQRMMKLNNENKPQFFMEPYVPIARKLQPWQFERGWLEYSHKHFTGRFVADSLLLLKRRVGTLNYQIIERMEFQNMLIAVPRQGDLFGNDL